MSRLRNGLALIFAVAAALFFMSSAGAAATTFCVPDFHRDCPDNGRNVAEADLETAAALDSADGQADRIVMDTFTYTDPDSFRPRGGDVLRIEANGSTFTTSDPTVPVLDLTADVGGTTWGRVVILSDARILVPKRTDGSAVGVLSHADDLDDVRILSLDDDAIGVQSNYATTLRNTTLRGTEGGGFSVAVTGDAGSGLIQLLDVDISDTRDGVVGEGHENKVACWRVRLDVHGAGIVSTGGGEVDLMNTIIDAGAEPAVDVTSFSDFTHSRQFFQNVTINGDEDLERRGPGAPGDPP